MGRVDSIFYNEETFNSEKRDNVFFPSLYQCYGRITTLQISQVSEVAHGPLF